MIIVTGGCGFIGSNLVHALNAKGIDDILVVDDLTDGHKFLNIANAKIADYMDMDDFRNRIKIPGAFPGVEAVFHEGACSATTEWNGKYVMDVNYRYSCDVLDFCLRGSIPFYYASSAAVYGGSEAFSISPENENPLNVYGYSKLLFDQHIRKHFSDAQFPIAGLRYFNVYGPREMHKGGMASVAWHFSQQLQESGECRLFAGTEGYDDGEQRRDFISVDDIVAVNMWLLESGGRSGVFNVGTGKSQTFNDVANTVIDWYGRGQSSYIEFPQHLKGAYQSFTEADISGLRDAGYEQEFLTVEQGTRRYMDWLATEGLRER